MSWDWVSWSLWRVQLAVLLCCFSLALFTSLSGLKILMLSNHSNVNSMLLILIGFDDVGPLKDLKVQLVGNTSWIQLA